MNIYEEIKRSRLAVVVALVGSYEESEDRVEEWVPTSADAETVAPEAQS